MTAFDAIGAVAATVGKVIDRVVPDPSQAATIKFELAKAEMSGELQQILAQIAVNQEEAKSPSLFIAGPRPFIMWVCGFGFAYVALIEPIARFAAQVVFGYQGAFPQVDTTLTAQVLIALLGLGLFRTYEKRTGVEDKR